MEAHSEVRIEPDRRAAALDPPAGRPGVRRAHRPRSRMRALYFAAASFWGFVAGSAAVVGCLRATGQAVTITPSVLWILAGAATFAVVGGVVLALAYREAARRNH